MTIVPAIDLRAGRCVRLLQGDPDKETRYDDDPAARARAFVRAGATRLHVVDLDGAFGTGENLTALRAICGAVDVPVQTGGGIRSESDVLARFAAGAHDAILGTLLVEEPELARELAERFGARIIAGLDARGEAVASRGWAATSGVTLVALACEVEAFGIERIIYTEIERDGAGTGFDVAALARLAAVSGAKITASGGARTLEDLRALRAGTPPSVDSAIVGRALYEGTLDLAEALREFA